MTQPTDPTDPVPDMVLEVDELIEFEDRSVTDPDVLNAGRTAPPRTPDFTDLVDELVDFTDAPLNEPRGDR